MSKSLESDTKMVFALEKHLYLCNMCKYEINKLILAKVMPLIFMMAHGFISDLQAFKFIGDAAVGNRLLYQAPPKYVRKFCLSIKRSLIPTVLTNLVLNKLFAFTIRSLRLN